jgi:hypothetical protein
VHIRQQPPIPILRGEIERMLLECPVSGDEITRKIPGGFGQQEFAIYDVLRARSPKVRSTVPSMPGAHTF